MSAALCAAKVGVALFDCLAAQPACLPPELVETFPGFIAVLREVGRQESGFNALALRDETERKPVRGIQTHADAVREITERRRKRHVLGVGMFQNTHEANHARLGLLDAAGFPTLALDPCRAVKAGAEHLAEDFAVAQALQRYNSGTLDGAPGYAATVLVRVRRERSRLAAPLAEPAQAATPQTAPPPCAPVWDAMALARCNARLTRVASTPPENSR